MNETNFTVNDDGTVTLKINPKIYALEIVYSAAYMFLDKAYIIIDGDPEKEFLIKIIPKNGTDVKKIALEFNNELINYSVYAVQAARTSEIRNAIVQRALGVIEEEYEEGEEEYEDEEEYDEGEGEYEEEYDEEYEDEISDEEALEDPLGITQPWTPEKMKELEIPDEVKEILKSVREESVKNDKKD